jgi:hypothetical protein
MQMTIETNARKAMNQASQGAHMSDLKDVLAELQWALTNNSDRPRTEFALRLAIEAIEKMEEGEVAG